MHCTQKNKSLSNHSPPPSHCCNVCLAPLNRHHSPPPATEHRALHCAEPRLFPTPRSTASSTFVSVSPPAPRATTPAQCRTAGTARTCASPHVQESAQRKRPTTVSARPPPPPPPPLHEMETKASSLRSRHSAARSHRPACLRSSCGMDLNPPHIQPPHLCPQRARPSVCRSLRHIISTFSFSRVIISDP